MLGASNKVICRVPAQVSVVVVAQLVTRRDVAAAIPDPQKKREVSAAWSAAKEVDGTARLTHRNTRTVPSIENLADLTLIRLTDASSELLTPRSEPARVDDAGPFLHQISHVNSYR